MFLRETNIRNEKELFEQYCALSGLDVLRARETFAVLYSAVRKRHPKLGIVSVTMVAATVRFAMSNETVLRFDPGSALPVCEVPLGKTARPRAWHRHQESREYLRFGERFA